MSSMHDNTRHLLRQTCRRDRTRHASAPRRGYILLRRRGTSVALGTILLLLAACGSNGSSDRDAGSTADAAGDEDDFDRAAMLASLGERVLVPVYRGFDERAQALHDAALAHCAALGTDQQDAAQSAARDAWHQAMDQWQVIEAMLLGPAAMDSRALRDQVYSWPLVNACAVDQDVMRKHTDPAYDISAQLVNRRGLDALEYLLFAPSLEVTCPPQSAPEGWDALTEDERRAARCALAADAAADLATTARLLRDAWIPEGQDYAGALAGAGQPGSSLPSLQEAVNLVSDAMFYLDSEVKDMKLAEPAGIAQNRCGVVQEACTDELESPWARRSRENLLANLRGLRMLFTGDGEQPGSEGTGFDDFLRARGASELATAMLANIDAALAAIEAIPAPMHDALQDDAGYQRVASAHAAVKAVTDDLKSQFLTVLGLELPDSAAADND